MKKILLKRIDIRNFKATASQVVDLPPGGIVVSGHNGSGKSSILEAIMFALGASIEAGRIINQKSKAIVSVSLTIEHPDGVDTFTRTLTPTLDAAGKITASTSSYVISGVPCKKTEYDIRINQLFGTKDWQYLVNPALVPFFKESRSILLAVAGCPSEKEFLQTSNPALAEKIGNTDFSDFEKREKAVIQDLGKKIDATPAKIEELSAMLQPVEEIDLTGVEDRIKEINAELSGVDAENATRADAFAKISTEATALRNEAQKLRTEAAQKLAEANKSANEQADEVDALIAEWNRTLSGFRRQADQIKAEMSDLRQGQQRKEAKIAEICANIQSLAEQCREISARVPSADGNCTLCGKWCADLQSKGLQTAMEANTRELDEVKKNGRFAVQQRDYLLAQVEAINKKIDGLQSMEHELETKIDNLGPVPTAPKRKVITETPESLALISQAEALEEKATELIQSNRLEIAQKPELVNELQQLNEKLIQQKGAATTQAQNEKIQKRISDLREDESELLKTQLLHKQHLAMLAQFHKDYANEVTGKCNEIFKDTEYSVILFSENMGNERGSATFLASKNCSTNLSTAENLIFWKLFTERVLSVHFGVMAPILVDNGECVSDETKFGSLHQKIIACVDKCDLTIIPLTMPSLKDGCLATFENK